MKLALKHQIILAPAIVLLLMALLLGFMQYSYWDLTLKRQAARRLGNVFLALGEADLATQRIYRLSVVLGREPLIDGSRLTELKMLHDHLAQSTQRISRNLQMSRMEQVRLQKTVERLNPIHGFDAERFVDAINDLRPLFVGFAEQMQGRRAELADVNADDIDELVAQTTLVSIVVLGAAIILGVFLSLTFSRRILRRIQSLSNSARRIASGDMVPPSAPKEIHDELDELTFSISRMSDRLIRVVSAEKLLEGAEEERRRLAMDIHDQTLSDLASVKRGIERLKCQQECAVEAGLLEEEMTRAISNLREVMDNLHPQTLDILGLGPALESHLERHFSGDGLPVYHFVQTEKAEQIVLTRSVSLALYRITIESVHNVVRHAGANRYEVMLDVVDHHFILSVEDNGKGFDFKQESESNHRGLHNIRERANAIGAKVCWKGSRFSSGTRFVLTLPLEHQEQEN
jgi:signal transduction histidine kinase